jgi:hypothetical protein
MKNVWGVIVCVRHFRDIDQLPPQRPTQARFRVGGPFAWLLGWRATLF